LNIRLHPIKTWVLGLGLSLDPNPNPKTQRNQISNPNPKIEKFLGSKNILFILRYFNEYIFSDFFKTQIFLGFGLGLGLGLVLGFFGSLGLSPYP